MKYIRITPRKFRQIVPLVKGKNPLTAIDILMSVKKKASLYGIELLKAAIANTKRMQGVDVSNLYISKLIADCGPTLKRFRAASMGRASSIRKRTSHLTLELDEIKLPRAQDAGAAKAKVKKNIQEPAQKTETVHAHPAKKSKSKDSAKAESTKKAKE